MNQALPKFIALFEYAQARGLGPIDEVLDMLEQWNEVKDCAVMDDGLRVVMAQNPNGAQVMKRYIDAIEKQAARLKVLRGKLIRRHAALVGMGGAAG